MADYNSALPIRTEGDLQEKLQSKIVDFVDPTKGAQVDGDKNLHVEIHGNDAAGVDRVVKLSESGNVQLDGKHDGAGNSNPSSVGLIAHDRSAAPGAGTQNKRPTAVLGDNNKTAIDVALSDSNGNSFSESNPLYVASVNPPGTEIANFAVSAAVAVGASANHTLTVAGTALELSQLEVAASGKCKVEVKIGAAGFETTRFVLFNSVANPNISLKLKDVITVPVGENVVVVRTNKDNAAQDIYSTIIGKHRA